jgi:hypothetical protein
MIKKTKNGFMVKCDSCGYEEVVDTHDDMFVFKEMLKESGWISKHRYKNICADCGGTR